MTYALGRVVEHDERSREFPARVSAAKPKTVLWSHEAPVLDQKDLGGCTGFALAQWLNTNYAQTELGDAGHRTAYLIEDQAIELYSAATKLDSIPGSYKPDDTGSSGLAVCKAGRKLGYLSAYHHAFGFDALLLALQHSPVIVGTEWTRGMFDPDHSGVIRPTGDVEGGHEYLILGGDMERQRLTILNSWADSWGVHGRAYISFTDFRTLLANHGDVTVPIV